MRTMIEDLIEDLAALVAVATLIYGICFIGSITEAVILASRTMQ